MPHDEAQIINGWAIYAHGVLIDRLEALTAEVERLQQVDPYAFQHHPAFKLLECVNRAMTQLVPANPNHADFRQGHTLGPNLTHWMRVKKTMPQRYRLFFQFKSQAPKTIIYAWLNDELTLRQAGSRSDCYAVFKAMVERGTIPSSFDELISQASSLPSAS